MCMFIRISEKTLTLDGGPGFGFSTRGNFFGAPFFYKNVSEAGVLFIETKVKWDGRPAPVWPARALVTASVRP